MRLLALLALATALVACARREEPPREAVVYPGQPVQVVAGTNYAAYPGLPVPPTNPDGSVVPPPPRYLGDSAEASSANVSRP